LPIVEPHASPRARFIAAALALFLHGAGCRESTPAPVAQPGGPTTAPAGSVDAAAPPAPESEGPAAVAEGQAPPAIPFDRVFASFAQESWYGVYMMGKKVGHVRRWSTRDADRADAPWVVGYELSMRFSAGGGPGNELRGLEVRRYAAAAPHALVETEFSQRGMQFDDARTARRDGDAFVLTRVVRGEAQPDRRIDASAETLTTQVVMAPLDPSMLPAPGGVRVPMWSWEHERDELLLVETDGVEETRRAGVPVSLMRLRITWPSIGTPITAVVATGGVAIESSLGASLVMKLEERDVATSGVSGLDVANVTVTSPTKLGDPRKVVALDVVLAIDGPDAPPSATGQRVERDPARAGRVTILRRSGETVAATQPEITAALAPDATIDSAHPTIVAASARLTEGVVGGEERVRAISDFVFRTLDKRLATHLPTASVVLAEKVGDCTEHTWLAVALLRAAGIPARPAYGIAYTGDGDAAFAYHAWVEVVLDGQWVAIDPTWGEARADATHIKLGDEPGRVAAFLDAIRIVSVTVPDGR
jgi:hypothetical protein